MTQTLPDNWKVKQQQLKYKSNKSSDDEHLSWLNVLPWQLKSGGKTEHRKTGNYREKTKSTR